MDIHFSKLLEIPSNCKRNEYISWDEFFMYSAFLCSQRSKDPSTQVGACIVNKENRIISSGYNGFCNGVSDDLGLWGKNNTNEMDNKYLYVCHAELNAISNCTLKFDDCSIYVTMFPCVDCSKLIIQNNIKKVVFATSPDMSRDIYKASKRLLELANVETIHYCGKRKITLEF